MKKNCQTHEIHLLLLCAGSFLCAIVSQTLLVLFKQFFALRIGDHVFDSITGIVHFVSTVVLVVCVITASGLI